MRILIAEDSATNRLLFSLTLSRLGHTADVAANGVEAVEMFSHNVYDLVFLDLHMPVMDGITTARALQKYNRRAVPIYAISGFSDPAREMLFAGAQIRRCIIKPLDKEKLNDVAHECGLAETPGPDAIITPAPKALLRTYVRELQSRLSACESAVLSATHESLRRESRTLRALGKMIGAFTLEDAAATLEEISLTPGEKAKPEHLRDLGIGVQDAVKILEERGLKQEPGDAAFEIFVAHLFSN